MRPRFRITKGCNKPNVEDLSNRIDGFNLTNPVFVAGLAALETDFVKVFNTPAGATPSGLVTSAYQAWVTNNYESGPAGKFQTGLAGPLYDFIFNAISDTETQFVGGPGFVSQMV